MARKFIEYLLLPFAGIYGLIVTFRNKLFDWEILPSKGFDIPIISVGNLAAGGTGKTPHIELLIRLFISDYKIAVLSRGYKRKTSGYILAGIESGPDEIGDEPCQIKRKFPEVIVAVDGNRVRGIKNLLKLEPGPDVILLDDAFQHRYVDPGLNILLDDFSRPFTSDFLLPSGRLREPASSKKRANIILVTKSPDTLKAIDLRVRFKNTGLHEFQHMFFTKIVLDDILPVFGGNIESFKGKNPDILIVSGIARPSTIKQLIYDISPNIKTMAFPDHNIYSEKDCHKIIREFRKLDPQNRIIITTEKDAVKLRELKFILSPVEDEMFFVTIKTEFLNNDMQNFYNHVNNYVRSNKRNSILHKKPD